MSSQPANLFPKWWVWPLFFLTAAIRVHYVMQPQNWWLLHPDEVYQTMEVAHSEMYGYGFRTFEYNPKPVIGPHTPDIHRQELLHGMWALRSHILPHAYVTVAWLLQLLGLNFPPFLTWKTAHTLVAATLPLAVYRYASVVTWSHDTAFLAAILCAVCAQLHVLGTHTLTNSLLAPPVFLALAHLHSIVYPPHEDSIKPDKCDMNKIPREKNRLYSPAQQSHVSGRNKAKHKLLPRNETTKKQSSQYPVEKVSNGSQGNKSGPQNPQSSDSRERDYTLATVSQNGFSHNGSLANVNNCLDPKVLNVNNCLDPKVLNGWPLTRSSKAEIMVHHAKKLSQNLVAGYSLGVCVYIRMDIVGLGACGLLPHLLHWSPKRTLYFQVLFCVLGFVGGILFGVIQDSWCYGQGVFTPYNWFRFNVEKDYSSQFFGSQTYDMYIIWIFFQNAGMTVLTVASALCCAFNVFYFSRTMDSEKSSWWTTVSVLFSWLLLLLIYCWKAHKELRFVHNVIVLVLVFYAILLRSALQEVLLSQRWKRVVLVVSLTLFALSQGHDIASHTKNPTLGGNKLAYKQDGDTQDSNYCLYRLSILSDVTGVFLDQNLYSTGGYTLLHHDVPIFSIFGKNFHEYRLEDRLQEPAKTSMSPHRNISVSYVARFSNYVSAHSSRYVMRFILEDQRYNYLVVQANRNLSYFGLRQPIFQCGTTYKVYHRPSTSPSMQAHLLQQTERATHLSNASVLFHEADMLYYHGAWQNAAKRFELALQMDSMLVWAYLPLAVSYYHMGNQARFQETMEQCYKKFSKEKCEMRRPLMSSVSAVRLQSL